MITNERQYKITKTQLSNFFDAIRNFDLEEVTTRIGSAVLAKAERDALESEAKELEAQVNEYELLKSGTVKVLKAESLQELPRILIQARISRGLSQKELAGKMGVKEQQIQRYESEEYSSASLKRLGEVAGALNLNISEVAEFESQPLSIRENSSSYSEIEWDRFPVKEMYRRGWFEGFNGSLSNAISSSEHLIKKIITTNSGNPNLAFHKKKVRSNSEIDPYAIYAWECRITFLANKLPRLNSYNPNSLTDKWIKSLIHLSNSENGPIKAKDFLSEVGIYLFVEPQLPNTHLDGAALLFGSNPIIGLTLRYDRLDNFWFVLLHEVAHILLHLKKGKVEKIFDDLEASADLFEAEADSFALEALIPKMAWETALPRFVRTDSAVSNFANDLNIHPAIVAGRIRHESNNYTILSSIIGHGEVRKHFLSAGFGM